MKTIVKPHRKISREVTDDDVERVIADMQEMVKIIYDSALCVALAHPQVEDEDPLRFFVTRNMVYINPVIERHSNYQVDSQEGCATFPEKPEMIKKRYRKVDISFQVIDLETKKLKSTRYMTKARGFTSFVFQHEIDHLNAIYCYDDTDE